MQRLIWKENLLATLDERIHEQPISAAEFSDIESDEFRLLEDFGHYDFANEMQVLHQSYNGKVGTHIITPFVTDTGEIFLVNRGWVPYEEEFHKPEGKQHVYGVIRKNPRHGYFALENEPEKNIWYNINLDEMGSDAGFYIEAQSEDDELKADYPIALPKEIKIYNEHLQYVITWFGMCVALLIMYYFRFFHDKKMSKKKNSKKK